MKVLLVSSLLFFYCYSSNAQMLPEGDTVTQEIETEHIGEGHIDTITETTTTVEHKTTGDLLHKDTGSVTTRYEGCLLYTSPSPRDRQKSRMPSSA